MSRKHDRTLAAIFADPVRANIRWDDVEALLVSLGAAVSEGRGSRVRVALGETRAVFHEPHPEKEIGKAAVRSIREFLVAAGVTWDEDEGHQGEEGGDER
jgi:hypothetical protein